MKIIILGAGQVGSTLAENLSTEANDISVVDIRKDCLKDLQDRLDIQTTQGHAAYPQILKQAGAEDADMVIAVTGYDEVNMVACQLVWTLFRTPSKIGRVRAVEYQTQEKLFNEEAIPINVLINPERVITDHITRLIKHPGALQVLNFADNQVQLVAIKAVHAGHLVGRELRFLRQFLPSVDTRVAAIFRQNKPIVPKGSTVIEPDDEIFFIAARDDIQAVMREIRGEEDAYKRILIAGGGHIGESLAKAIEKNYQVKVIERNYSRCQTLSENLNKTLVIHGEASDQELLFEENIEDTDVFCALTNDDEANIMTSMLAKRLGARKVMTLINNRAYVDLVQGGEIDIAISPQQTTISSLLSHIRRGDVVKVHSLRRGAAEAIEAIAHGDKQSSQVIGRSLGRLNLPPDTTVGAIVRDKRVLIAHDDIVIEPEDHLILFLIDKTRIAEVERLFQSF